MSNLKNPISRIFDAQGPGVVVDNNEAFTYVKFEFFKPLQVVRLIFNTYTLVDYTVLLDESIDMVRTNDLIAAQNLSVF